MVINSWFFAAGLLISMWVLTPIVSRSRTLTDGFYTGLIAAAIYLGISKLFGV